MKQYDVVLIHPPAIYDFRERVVFPGALGGSVEQVQFDKVPIGMLSIAEYLDRHGHRVVVDNLCDRMVSDRKFDAVKHLKETSARIFAIGLNFQWHAQGALEMARLCKELHPESVVVMGGLTASRFHQELIQEYPFVDAVIRGEGEKALLKLTDCYLKEGRIGGTPSLTSRDREGNLVVTALLPASTDLDEFDFTRLDLLEPKSSVFPENSVPRWSLAVCRGCLYNCAICGGSAHTYQKHMGMARPAFRSPARIIDDIKKLVAQGVRFVGLYQDPRMGGRKYWRELLEGLASGVCHELERLSIDMLVPCDEEFIREVAKIGPQVVMHICPDTGSDQVRRRLGRPYSNEELLETVRLCHKHGLPVTTFFSVGLAGESASELRETWELWAKLTEMDRQSRRQGAVQVPLGGPIVGPIVLDPGSPAFDDPAAHGYRLRYPTLKEYVAGLSLPSWHQWLNYRTELLDLPEIVELVFATVRFSIEQRYQSGIYDDNTAIAESARLALDREVVGEIERIMTLAGDQEREKALKDLLAKYHHFLNRPIETFLKGGEGEYEEKGAA